MAKRANEPLLLPMSLPTMCRPRVARMGYYELQRHWTRKVVPHLGDKTLNDILVRDFNRYLSGRYGKADFVAGGYPLDHGTSQPYLGRGCRQSQLRARISPGCAAISGELLWECSRLASTERPGEHVVDGWRRASQLTRAHWPCFCRQTVPTANTLCPEIETLCSTILQLCPKAFL